MKILASMVSGVAVMILVGGCAIGGPDMPWVYGEKYLQKKGEPKALVDAVCNHRPLPPETFSRLATYSNEYVDRLLGENPSCPPELLKQFSESSNFYVRRGVAINTNTPKDMLIKLTADPNRLVRNSAGANRSLSPSVMQTIADSDDWEMQTGLAANPSASPEVLRQIYNRYKSEGKYSVGDYFATNRNLPEDIARDIYLREKDKSDSLTLNCLVMNPAVSSSLLSEIYYNSKCEIPLSRYAQNPHCPPEIRSAYQKAEAEKAQEAAQQRAKERAREQKRKDNAGVKWL